MKKILLGILAIAIFTGCKKGTTITYRVINNSGEQITFKAYYNYSGGGSSSSIVNNGDTRDILIMSKADGKFDDGYIAGQHIDSIPAVTNTNRKLKKDLTNAASWTKTTSKKQSLHSFTTEITSKDIQ